MGISLLLDELKPEEAKKVFDLWGTFSAANLYSNEGLEATEVPKADKATPTETISPKTQVEYDIVEVRSALAKYSKEYGTAKAKDLLATVGASKLTDVNKEMYHTLMEGISNG